MVAISADSNRLIQHQLYFSFFFSKSPDKLIRKNRSHHPGGSVRPDDRRLGCDTLQGFKNIGIDLSTWYWCNIKDRIEYREHSFTVGESINYIIVLVPVKVCQYTNN